MIYRPGTLGWYQRRGLNIVNDGGDDAPLTKRQTMLWRVALAVVIVLGIVVAVASR